MKNPKNMKYLKLFESFFQMNELMFHLREIAKKLIQNLPTSDNQMTLDDFKIEISLNSDIVDGVKQLLAVIRQNEQVVGEIFMDFESREYPDYIMVQYTLSNTNEGNSLYCRSEIYDRDLLNADKIRRRIKFRNELSAQLPK